MTIHYKRDSDGFVHQVWAQRQAASCAVASIWMARNQALQMTVNETEWNLAWRLYHGVVRNMMIVPSPPAPMCLSEDAHENNQNTFGNMFAKAGTYMGQVEGAIKMDGLKVLKKTGFAAGSKVDAAVLSDTTPAIVLLGWYVGGKRLGGHFIVASRKTRAKNVVYLDLWGGKLVEMGAGPKYQAHGKFEQVLYLSG